MMERLRFQASVTCLSFSCWCFNPTFQFFFFFVLRTAILRMERVQFQASFTCISFSCLGFNPTFQFFFFRFTNRRVTTIIISHQTFHALKQQVDFSNEMFFTLAVVCRDTKNRRFWQITWLRPFKVTSGKSKYKRWQKILNVDSKKHFKRKIVELGKNASASLRRKQKSLKATFNHAQFDVSFLKINDK